MAEPRPVFSPAESAPPLPAPSAWLTVQTAVVVVGAAWLGGGRFAGAPALLLALAALSWPLLAWQRALGAPVQWRALAPAVAWLGFIALAWLNPSHVRTADGTWVPRTEWIAWLPTTADRARTLDAAGLWLAALLQGGALVAADLPRRAVRRLWTVVAVNGFVLAAVGAGFRLSGAERMLGQFPVPEPTYFFATFFYKNHWAAWGALSAIAGSALALGAWRRAVHGDLEARGRAMFFGALAVLTLCTLPLPGSRAGALLALVIGAAGLGRAWLDARRAPSARIVAIGAALVLAGLGASFYADRVHEDLARTRAQVERHAAGGVLDLRFELARDTARMAAARPVFGWGLGCYEIVFPLFQGDYLRDERGRPTARFEFAHNDWLQVLAEGGWVGALLLVAPAAALGWRSWRDANRIGRWALGGAIIVALYAWIDFPFHNPAVLLLWTVLVATARGWRDAAAR